MARRIKVEISDAAYEAALQAREESATKKRQCELLGIAYNTKRLDTLLEEYEDEKATRKEMVKKYRTKPITPQEKANMAEAYLTGDSIDQIAKRTYRSPILIRRQLELMGVRELRYQESPNPINPHMVPDEAMSYEFEVGQKVFVPGYKCLGEVKKIYEDQPDGVPAYRVYLLDSTKHRNVTYKAFDLGCLKYLEELGVNTSILEDNMDADEIRLLINETMIKARKNATRKDK